MPGLLFLVWLACDGRSPQLVEDDSDAPGTETGSADDTDSDAPSEPSDPLDPDGDGYRNAEDCAPWNRAVSPGVAEDPCNSYDDDCDGLRDEGREAEGFVDADGDGAGDPARPVVCSEPRSGEGVASEGTDCEDRQAAIHPGAPEICNETDDDCDGDADEEPPPELAWARDLDGDGFGAGEQVISCSRPSWAHVLDASDCDDSDPDVFPGAAGWCNGEDDDCDGLTDAADPDESGPATWYADADGDGFGAAATMSSCAPGPGWAEEPGDCDDADASAFPGAPESCADGRDTDCDGISTCVVEDADAFVHGTSFRSFGGSVAPLGDTDGDGFAEVAIGMVVSPRPAGFGRIYLLAGPPEGRLDAWDAAAVIAGERNLDCIGPYVTAGGDLDGDGMTDLLVRAEDHGDPWGQMHDPPIGAWAISGATRGETTLASAFAHVPGAGRSAGAATLAGDDLDGDGADDLVVGEPTDPQGGYLTGSTFVYAGPIAGELHPYDARTRIFGEAPDMPYPQGDVHAGDLDGDGVSDLVIVGVTDAWVLTDLPAGALRRSDAAVATLPDVGGVTVLDADGDGLADIAAIGGSVLAVHQGPFSGVHDAASAVATYEPVYAVSAGDPDGDGDVDLFLANGENGWLEELTPGTHALDRASRTITWGGPGVGRFAGDVDGDGADDLVLTAPLWDDPFPEAGAAWFLSGSSF